MVYFVGAGPGDKSLITVKGREYIRRADVIIYAGSLVNPALLEYAKDDAEIYNSAKMTLDEVISVMTAAENAGKTTVRLHTGDPSLYGTITEQIKRLEENEISYTICPGVSSFAAAAAALGIEYTLPEVSQSLIITRAKGKTDVPEKEKLSFLASHGCSMVLFLSAKMAEEIKEELTKEGSGYSYDTPCAICYRVSWDDERIIRTTLGSLYDEMLKSGIEKTALIIVGDVIAAKDNKITQSRLYADDFSTGYRKGNDNDSIAVICFSEGGQKIAERICSANSDSRLYVHGKDFTDSKALISELFDTAELIIFICASGIAVRLIAPHLKSKATDPAVLCIDDTGRFVISLLSGHLGGANEWCEKIAEDIGGEPVITTATDRHNVFAVDSFARENNLAVEATSSIKEISSSVLKGEPIGYYSDCGFNVTKRLNTKRRFSTECRLYPKNIFLGIGAKKGKGCDELLSFVSEVFLSYELPLMRICGVYSISDKKDEAGIIALAKHLRIEYVTYTADELGQVDGSFNNSGFVENTVGVGNVCERAAVLGAMRNSDEKSVVDLIIKKIAKDGMTLAAAEVLI